MTEFVSMGSPLYGVLFAALLVGRGSDLFSTWIATPNLVLEGNPIARKLGWKWGIPLNLAICLSAACWPLLAVMLTTTSSLVAARNFQSAWLVRSCGENQYKTWLSMRLMECPPVLYCFCMTAQSLLVAAIGIALMWFGRANLIVFGIGSGVLVYSVAIVVFTWIGLGRIRTRM